jgi:hypothetical protein
MTERLNVQAEAVMWSTIEPQGWTIAFGVHVTDANGEPVTGLTKANFKVWELTTIGALDVQLVTEVNQDFPASHMPGIYRVQTKDMLGPSAPAAQQFLHAIRVASRRDKVPCEGLAVTAVTYLGKPGVVG